MRVLYTMRAQTRCTLCAKSFEVARSSDTIHGLAGTPWYALGDELEGALDKTGWVYEPISNGHTCPDCATFLKR